MTPRIALGLLAALAPPAFLAPGQAPSSQARPAPFSLSISAPSHSFPAGVEVRVGVTLTNRSKKTVRSPPMVSRPGRGEDIFQVLVTAPSGYAAPRTAYSRWLARPTAGELGLAVVRPRGALHESILINKLFDITAPGTYRIRVCENWLAPGRIVGPGIPLPRMYPRICSNTLTITVTP